MESVAWTEAACTDIILRDPPGSNSFASIEAGKSISFTEEGSFTIAQTANTQLEMKLGVKFAAGGGLAGPVIEAEAVNSIAAGLSLAVNRGPGGAGSPPSSILPATPFSARRWMAS